MRRYLFGLAFTSVLAIGQEQASGPRSNLDAYRAQALENALRQPNKLEAKQPNLNWKYGFPPNPNDALSSARLGSKTCAIPLTKARVNTAVDPKIQERLTPEALAMDKKFSQKAMPVCAE